MHDRKDWPVRRAQSLPSGGTALAFVFGFMILASVVVATSPALSIVLPRGAQRGTEVELQFLGDRLADAQQVLFTRTGIEVIGITPVSEQEVKVKVRIAPDCPLGRRAVYIRTWSGISGICAFTVGPLKEIVAEPEPNDVLDTAPVIEANVTVNGTVQNEDVDYYAFAAKKGERWNFEVEGLRLANSRLDPNLTLFGPDNRELKQVDDTALLGQDAAFGFDIPEDGNYKISMRESSYGGGGNFYYRLHVGTFPRPMGVFPAGAKPGESVALDWMEDTLVADGPTTVPTALDTDGLYPEVNGLSVPSKVPFRVSTLENFIEAEPNDSGDVGTTITLPGAANGVIGKAGDFDWYRFRATKGQVFDFNVYGRRLGSPIDSVCGVNNAAGAGVVGDDDAAKPDSYFRFTAPEDGVYSAYVTDHLRRGGENFFYRLEATAPEPGLGLVGYIPGRKDLQSVAVAAGNRNAFMLSVRRKDLGGAMKFVAENLPAGMTAEIMDCPDGIGDIPVLLSADASTTAGGTLANIVGRPADENVKVEGRFDQIVEMVLIENNVTIQNHAQKEMPLALTQPVPYSIEILEPKVPIVRSGVMNLIVKATKQGDWNNPIDVRLLWNPPGIGSSTARIEAGQTTTTLQLNAAGNAGIGDWKIAAIGGATVGNAGTEVSSQLAKLTISEPWIGLTFDKVRTDQGTQIEMKVTPTVNRQFAGEAVLTLFGLPNKVTAAAQNMTTGTAELKYLLDIPAEAPAGKFDNVFAQAVIMDQGEPVTHNIGGAELRIDVPLPPKADAPPPAPVEPGAAPEPKKPEGPQRGDRKMAIGTAPFGKVE